MTRMTFRSPWQGVPAIFLGTLLLLTPVLRAGANVTAAGFSSISQAVQKEAPSKASVAIQVTRLGETPADSQVLFARNADRAMIPASNLKLVTSAAALDVLGADFRFRTLLLARGDLATGEVEIAVIGDGDPSFGDAELFRKIDGWGTRTVFKTWADVLQQAGVKKVSRVLIDDSVFDEQYIHPNWPDDQRHRWYEAQVGGVSLNINCVDVYLSRGSGKRMNYRLDPPTSYVEVANTCDRGNKNAVWLTRAEGGNKIILAGETNASQQGPMNVTVHGPTQYFGTVLAETLREAGLEASDAEQDRTVRQSWQQLQSGEWDEADPSAWRLVAIHETPIATVLARTNKDSINLYAEALAKRAAHAMTGLPGSWADGEAVVREYLGRIGSDPAQVVMDDGSGMSRQNRVTADQICDILAAQHAGADFEVYRASLSEAGKDGTLKSRFRDSDRSDLQGRVFGKTGYINGVSTCSGYLLGRDGQWYAFSVLVNDCPSNEIWKAKRLQEAVVLALDRSLEPAVTAAAGE